MNKYLIFGFFLILCKTALSQNPTVIFGQAATPDGGTDSMLLEQPENAPNPLGNPIVLPPEPKVESELPVQNLPANERQKSSNPTETPENMITQDLPANPQPSAQYTLQKEDSMIQNTIYRGTDRLYDIQSIPLKELDKINVLGLDPDLTTYPVR